jgi:hypothetical protein
MSMIYYAHIPISLTRSVSWDRTVLVPPRSTSSNPASDFDLASSVLDRLRWGQEPQLHAIANG